VTAVRVVTGWARRVAGRNTPLVLQALRLVPATGTGLTLGVCAAGVVAGLAPAGAIVASGWVVQSLALAGAEGLDSPEGHRAVWLLVLFAALFAVGQSASALSRVLAGTVGTRLDGQLQRRAIRAVNGPATVAHLDDAGVQDHLSRLTGVAMGGYTPGGAVSGLVTSAILQLQGLAALTVLAVYHWWLALGLLAARVWWEREGRRAYLGQTAVLAGQARALRRAGYLRDLVLLPAGAKEIRLFGLTGWLTERFRAEWDTSMAQVWRRRDERTAPAIAALVVLTAAEFGAFALLGRDGVDHVISIGAAVIFLRAVNRAGQSSLGTQDMQVAYGLSVLPAVGAVERAAAQASAPLSADRRREPSALPGSPGAPPDGTPITLTDVTFGYPGGSKPILSGLSLVIPAARSLAVVGVNGAGKTTLIKLLCRLYDPDGGTIKVGAANLRDLDARGWQRQIAAVFQNFQRYELSARDNIAFGALRLAGDQPALDRAADRAGILDTIRGLPNGWDTPLARHLDGGADLSGGQWQRIALARAMLALEGGARLLILDEPTASLDPRAEADFYDRFLELTHGTTTIVISHRFSTVRRADLICVLDGGTVTELGSHEELLEADGQYARMYTAQSARFTEAAS
jgi:ATP-binding cassette subfamily B protein